MKSSTQRFRYWYLSSNGTFVLVSLCCYFCYFCCCFCLYAGLLSCVVTFAGFLALYDDTVSCNSGRREIDPVCRNEHTVDQRSRFLTDRSASYSRRSIIYKLMYDKMPRHFSLNFARNLSRMDQFRQLLGVVCFSFHRSILNPES
jgi:hypothetical protein